MYLKLKSVYRKPLRFLKTDSVRCFCLIAEAYRICYNFKNSNLINRNCRREYNMNLTYKRATIGDIDILVKTRIEVLRAANKLCVDTDMSEVERQSYSYYQKALWDGSHIAYLVFNGNCCIGTGGVSFFQVMPTYHNPSGKKAYIMNMYTNPKYRRKGIAYKTLDMLVKDSKSKGISAISLEATDMGRPLYEKYGFVKMNNEMELPE